MKTPEQEWREEAAETFRNMADLIDSGHIEPITIEKEYPGTAKVVQGDSSIVLTFIYKKVV